MRPTQRVSAAASVPRSVPLVGLTVPGAWARCEGATQTSPQSSPPCLLKPVCILFGNRRCLEKTCGGAARGRAVASAPSSVGCQGNGALGGPAGAVTAAQLAEAVLQGEGTRAEGPSVCIYLWDVSLHFLQRKGSFSVPFTGPRINCTFLKPLGSRSLTVPFPVERGLCVRLALPGRPPGLPPLTVHAACSPTLRRWPRPLLAPVLLPCR